MYKYTNNSKYFFFLFLFFSSCSFDTNGLPDLHLCGNGNLDKGEDCEPGLVLSSCQGLGYSGGKLSCSNTCKYDVSSCGTLCGECRIGEKNCFENAVYLCVSDDNNCGIWQLETNCSDDELWCNNENGEVKCSSECINECSFGEKRCYNSKTIEKCISFMQNGVDCNFWGLSETCGDGYKCTEDASSVSCTEDCINACDTLGERACSTSGSSVMECRMEGSCQQWVNIDDCAEGDICFDNDGDVSCIPCNLCVPSSVKCSDDKSGIDICKVDNDTTCTYWDTEPCAEGNLCIDVTGDATCSDCVICNEGDFQCSADHSLIEVCTADASGCTSWVQLEDCAADNKICRNNSGSVTCEQCNVCDAGRTMCSTDALQVFRCETDAYSCTYWSLNSSCDPAEQKRCVLDSGGVASCTLIGDTCDSPWEVKTLPYSYSVTDFKNIFSNYIDFQSSDCEPSDADAKDLFYKISLNAGDRLVVENTGDLNLLFKIINSCDAYTACHNYVSGRGDNILKFDVHSSGDYLLAVESDMLSSSTSSNSVTVSLSAATPLCTVTEAESAGTTGDNDSVANADATPLTSGQSYCSTLFSYNDVDCTQILIPPSGGNLRLWTSSAFDLNGECSGDTKLSLYDPYGSLLYEDTGSGIDGVCSSLDSTGFDQLNFVPAGKFIACVSENGGVPIPAKNALNMEVTPPASAVHVVLYEDFEGTTFPPNGWSFETNRTSPSSAVWQREQETGTPNHYAAITSDFDCDNCPDYDEYKLITPSIDLTGYTHVYLAYWQKDAQNFPSMQGRLFLDNGTDVILLNSLTRNYINGWHYYYLDISSYSDLNIKLIFNMQDKINGSNKWWNIDGISVVAW